MATKHVWKYLGVLFIFIHSIVLAGFAQSPPIDISPSGPIVAYAGDTVHINCSINGPLPASASTDLSWKLVQEKNSTLLRNNSNERHSTKWLTKTTIQLSISDLEFGDAGSYNCESQFGSKAVRIWIIHYKKDSDKRPCSHTQFKCPDGNCVFLRFKCDRVVDCAPSAADEWGCESDCGDNFRCDNGQCIDKANVCDTFRITHCRDGSDEMNCRYIKYEYPGSVAAPTTEAPSKTSLHTWHFNAIYSGVAGIVGLVCVIAVVVITVCRIHMRREALLLQTNQRPEATRRRHNRIYHRPGWQPNVSQDRGLYDTYDCPPPTNLAINVNFQLSPPAFSELAGLMNPPPYRELEEPVREESPPPPYSTLDRTGGTIANSVNNNEAQNVCADRYRSPNQDQGTTLPLNINNTNNNRQEHLALQERRALQSVLGRDPASLEQRSSNPSIRSSRPPNACLETSLDGAATNNAQDSSPPSDEPSQPSASHISTQGASDHRDSREHYSTDV